MALAQELRDNPLLPTDPQDPDKSFTAIADGVLLPAAHCAFKGCPFVAEDENFLRGHVLREHLLNREFLIFDWEKEDEKRFRRRHWEFLKYDYYIKAIQHLEEQKMPDVGLSVDRRALSEAVRLTKHVRCLVCFVCAQVKLDTGDENTTDISLTRKTLNSSMTS